MRRRIVQHGPSTLTISLPAKWASSRGLKKGDELFVSEVDNGLLISTDKGVRFKQKSIDVRNMGNILPHMITALYKKGHDEVLVNYELPSQLEEIHAVLDRGCIGFEIVEETANLVTIKNVSEPTGEEFKTIFRRIFYFLLSTADDGLIAAEKKDAKAHRKLVLRDQNINKLTDFCRRLINKRSQTEYVSDSALYHITEQLEKIGDCYGAINHHLANHDVRASKNTLSYYRKINILLRDYEKLFFDFQPKKLDKLAGECKKTLVEIEEYVPEPKSDFFVIGKLNCIVLELHNLMGATLLLRL